MSSFKNMKIAITPEQPLDEIVAELEKKGYGQGFSSVQYNQFIICRDFGVFFDSHGDDHDFTLATITEIKEME